MTTTLAPHPATDRQVAFLQALVREREVSAEYVQWLAGQASSGLTTHGARVEIDSLLAKPKRKSIYATVEPGHYLAPSGEVFEVVKSDHSGRTFAKHLVLKSKGGHCGGHYDQFDGSYFECGVPFQTTEQQRDKVWDNLPVRDFGCLEVKVTGAKWTYAKGAMAQSSTWIKMGVAEAEAYGQKYGVCAMCGRLLTNPASIERGIGPVCAGKF